MINKIHGETGIHKFINIIHFINKHPIKLILLGSIVLTAIFCTAAYSIGVAYDNHYSYFFDSVSYAFMDAKLFILSQKESILSLIKYEWINNDRQPFRTIFLLLFSPSSLGSPYGHLAFLIPFLGFFLFIFGTLVYKRTQSLPYTLSVMLLFFAMRGHFRTTDSLIPNLLDLPSALILGIAICFLLKALDDGKYRWLIAFALFACISFLSRYPAGFYSVVTCGPLFLFYLFKQWKTHNHWKPVLVPFAIVFGIGLSLTGYFAIKHTSVLITFYKTYGDHLSHGRLDSFKYILSEIPQFTGTGTFTLLIILCTLQIFLQWKSKLNWQELGTTFWPGLGHILFMGGVMQITSRGGNLFWALPPLMLFAVAPITHTPSPKKKLIFFIIAIALTLYSVRNTRGQISLRYKIANNPSEEMVERQKLSSNLGELVSSYGDNVIWNTYFNQFTWYPSMEVFYKTGKLPLPVGEDFFFANRKEVWQGNFPGRTPLEMASLAYENTNNWVNIAVVFGDSSQVHNSDLYNNPITQTVATYFSQTMPQDSTWEKVFSLKSKTYGTLDGYRNKRNLPESNYWHILKFNSNVEKFYREKKKLVW